LTGGPITNPYSINETYTDRFKELAPSYEEARAEAVAMYLAFFREPYEIFCKIILS
jgi:hypothetical protein